MGKRTKPPLLLSLIFLAGGLAMLIGVPLSMGRHHAHLEEIRVVSSAGMDGLERGTLIAFEGRIVHDVPRLKRELVIGVREQRHHNQTTWNLVEEYLQTVDVQVGDARARVEFLNGHPSGSYETTYDDEDSQLRVRGYRPGTALAVAGEVISTAPPTIRADYHFAGTREEHLAMLDTSWSLLPGLGLALLGGILVTWYVLAFRKERASRRA